MGKVPKKPNKRKTKKPKAIPSAHRDLETSQNNIGFQRFLQANALRKQIKDNLGDIFSEISPFEDHLSKWASTGRDLQGSCEIPRLEKIMEWRLHSNISKYPEVWFKELV
jgi:hypothetical protein